MTKEYYSMERNSIITVGRPAPDVAGYSQSTADEDPGMPAQTSTVQQYPCRCSHSQAFHPIRTHVVSSQLRRAADPFSPKQRLRTTVSAATDIATTSTSGSSTTSSTVGKADTYFPSSLPPTEYKSTRCICVKEDVGLWVLQQDFPVPGQAGINLNCVISQLADGSLLVCSPVAPTPQCLAQLQQLPGTVQHIMVPSCSPEHFYYTAALAQHYPEAQIWIPPGLFDSKLPGLEDVLKPLQTNPKVKLITDEAFQQQLGNDVAFSFFDGGFGFREATVLLKAQKAVVFSDLAFAAMNDEGMPLAINRAIGKLVGIYKRLGSPIGFFVMSARRAVAQQWVKPILSWDFDTICGGHLTAAIPNGKEEFNRCLKFLL